ncbi:MAG: endonuclease/exonuclease/phosphatase family protein [Candidatus Melainabacteria bacterium]|nr:endonuclease/exonuclease/phosphatase family protein [Candidatus Melainabacteria bacterium]
MKPSRQFFKQSAQVLTILVLLLVATCSIAGFFSEQDQVCELLSHFRLVWIALLLLVSSALVAMKRLDCAFIGFFILILNACDVVWLYSAETRNYPEYNGPGLELMQLNVAGDKNSNVDSVVSLIQTNKPDFIAFSEVNHTWVKQLDERLADYPFRFSTDLDRSDGLAIYSKYKLTDVDTKYSKVAKRPRFVGTIRGDRRTNFSFAHPILPVLPEYRNEELRELADDALASQYPMVVMGDLNCTPWSYYFNKLLRDGKLYDSERGFGPQCTFHTGWIVPFLPIDHCLVTSRLEVKSRRVGPNVGSDHLPVFVHLNLH